MNDLLTDFVIFKEEWSKNNLGFSVPSEYVMYVYSSLGYEQGLCNEQLQQENQQEVLWFSHKFGDWRKAILWRRNRHWV